MAGHHDADFQAEYAKSGRASCKMCSRAIPKESLRLAIMVQSPIFDGKMSNWYHYACFWKRAQVPSTDSIHGFDSLRWEDQQKIKEKLSGGGGGAAGDDTVPGSTQKDFATEYAKSGRSSCRGCQYNIAKDEVRISRKDFESQRAKMYGPQDLWHHVDCFVKDRDALGFATDMDPTKIVGFSKLKKEDKEEILEKLGKGEKKKRKAEEDSDQKKKSAKTKETPEEKALREQSQAIWKVRDTLNKEVSNNALKGLLEYNNQELPSGESKLLDRVSDGMVFGALKPCPECGGQLAYKGDGYRCTGNITEWTKCLHITKTPKRKAFKIPEEFHDVDYLKKYKYKPKERLFPPSTASSQSSLVSSASASSSLASAEEPTSNALAGMTFAIIGKLNRQKSEVTKAVLGMGGKLVTKVDKSVTACLSTKEEVEKNNKSVQQAKKADVHVIKEEFLDDVKKGGAALLITQHSICDWGSDPHDRIKDVPDGPAVQKSVAKAPSRYSASADAMFTKSVPAKLKMKLKGGAAVDPDSGLEAVAHVLEVKGDIYNAVLGLVDIVRGTNSYYKLQILESDKSSRWWVFRAWGRVGTTIGGNKLQTCHSRNSAIDNFCQVYGEKTGNDWEDRNSFVKHPNRFYPLDIDYGADDEEVKKLDSKAGSTSKLPKSVQDLVKMIFDVDSMKKAMLEFEIDLKKMPLGKLSKKQIGSAYKVLNELQGLIEKGGTPTQFLDASNRFYTLIPHDFGMKKPPMLDSKEVITAKTQMLDNLMEIEVAYSMLKSGDDGAEDPIDTHYKKLKTDIKELPADCEEYKNLLTYVKNTHGATHTQYDLEVQDIWKVARDGEGKRFRPFRDLHNRQLLWHGSRTTNYAGILSQGLRIAPPEAPVTGYMFGKGIYFADMVSKSANYCQTNKSNPVGIMLLCEVALGNMYELTGAKYITQLPKGMHSTKGCGRTGPDPTATITDKSGVGVPVGKGVDTSYNTSSLLYNEYIVYDIAQVNIKYALKMNFKYKW